MKTEDLKALGLTDEQVQQVFAMNGADLKREKDRADGLQTQLQTARDGLKAFEGVDVDELKGQVAKLTADLAAQADAHKKELADRDFTARLDAAIQAKRGRSAKAIRAMLDLAALKAGKDPQADLDAALDKLAKESAYLFEPATPPPYAAGTGTGKVIGAADFAKMSYRQRVQLKQTDPAAYEAMKNND